MNELNELTTPLMTASWIEEDLLCVRSIPTKSMDAKTYMEHYEQFTKFMDSNGPCKIFIDFSESVAIPRSLRKSMNEHINRHAKQIAVYSKNSLGLTIAKLVLSFTKPKVPTKIFNDKHRAMDWLKSIEEAKS